MNLMKLKTIGMAAVAALALVAGRAQAQEAGWDTKYGILFTLPNLLQNNSSEVINDINGMVGGQYNLSPRAGLRLTANLGRQSFGIVERTVGVNTTKTVPGITSSYTVDLQAQYMLRMTTASFSPYVGAGAGLSFVQDNQSGDDSTNGVVTAKYDSMIRRDWGLGLLATAGVEWRVHKSFALFAEYQADLTFFTAHDEDTKVTVGATTTESKVKQAQYLNLNMGIGQGGKLGFVAFF
jgi:opacity protein-like surface antigen